MHKFKLAALAALSSVALSGCATVINGTSQDYKVKTDPSGATVKFTNGSTCVSPCEISLKRRHDTRAFEIPPHILEGRFERARFGGKGHRLADLRMLRRPSNGDLRHVA